MTQKDFQVGQTVFLFHIRNFENESVENRIRRVKVLSVDEAYVTVDFWEKVRFDIKNCLQKDTDPYSPSWKLFLSREAIYDYINRKSQEAVIRRNINAALHEMSSDEIQNLYSIIKPYIFQ